MEQNRDVRKRHTNTVNRSLTKEQRQYKVEMIDFSINGAGTRMCICNEIKQTNQKKTDTNPKVQKEK